MRWSTDRRPGPVRQRLSGRVKSPAANASPPPSSARPEAVAVNMGVASYKADWKNGFYGQGGFEFPLLLGTVALSLCLTGPGRLSVDHLMSK